MEGIRAVARGTFEGQVPVAKNQPLSVKIKVQNFRKLFSNICAGNFPSFPAQILGGSIGGEFVRKTPEGLRAELLGDRFRVSKPGPRPSNLGFAISRTLVSNICAGNFPSFPAQIPVWSERPELG